MLVKLIQLFYSFFISQALKEEGGTTLIWGSFVVVAIFMLIGYLAKVKRINFNPWYLLLIAGIAFLISPTLIPASIVFFLFGLYLYAFVGAETQVTRRLNQFAHLPEIVSIIIFLAPLVAFYYLTPYAESIPAIFYLVTFIFERIAIYSMRQAGNDEFLQYPDSRPPFLAGLFFGIVFSGVAVSIYYFANVQIDIFFLGIILLFFTGGILMIYMTIDNYIRRYL